MAEEEAQRQVAEMRKKAEVQAAAAVEAAVT